MPIQYIAIDSRDRNLTTSPKPNNYVFRLPFPLKNVQSIYLIKTIIPNVNNVTNEPYLVLEIPEINHQQFMSASNGTLQNATSVLVPCIYQSSSSAFLACHSKINDEIIYYPTTKNVRLDRITVRFKKSNGDYFDFGTDSNPASPNSAIQHFILLKVETDFDKEL